MLKQFGINVFDSIFYGCFVWFKFTLCLQTTFTNYILHNFSRLNSISIRKESMDGKIMNLATPTMYAAFSVTLEEPSSLQPKMCLCTVIGFWNSSSGKSCKLL